MGAYNRTNGEACCGEPTLIRENLAREDWGFKGYVVSDCGALDDLHRHHNLTKNAAESAALAVKNGCDLNCGCTYCKLHDAVLFGLLSEADIDVALRRLLTTQFQLGMFDPPARVPWSKLAAGIVNCDAHKQLTRRMARESIGIAQKQWRPSAANESSPYFRDRAECAGSGSAARQLQRIRAANADCS